MSPVKDLDCILLNLVVQKSVFGLGKNTGIDSVRQNWTIQDVKDNWGRCLMSYAYTACPSLTTKTNIGKQKPTN